MEVQREEPVSLHHFKALEFSILIDPFCLVSPSFRAHRQDFVFGPNFRGKFLPGREMTSDPNRFFCCRSVGGYPSDKRQISGEIRRPEGALREGATKRILLSEVLG